MIIVPEKKAILLRLRDPCRITSIIPQARLIEYKGKRHVAVPHQVEVVQVLRNMGIAAPSPIGYYYDWPGRFTPFAHQKEIAEFLSLHNRAFNLADLGCVSGDARVRVSRKSKSYETSLRDLFKKYHALPDKQSWKVRSLMGDKFGLNKLLDVLYQGEKAVLRITLADGKTIECTADHAMARPDGSWTMAGDLIVGDELVTNGSPMVEAPCPDGSVSVKGGVESSKIVNIADAGITDVYDLCMEGPHHNFVADGVVVHNSGKTLGTLWAYDYLRARGVVTKTLVITPLSTLERTWGDELFNHFPHLDSVVLHGTRDKRLKLLDQDVDLYLINHDGIKVPGFVEALKERADINLVIVDEIAQIGRTASTDRFKVLNTIINKQVPRRAWGMTGAPIPNAPTDAWAQCRLLVPERVPPYFNRFKDQVMRQVSQFVWVPRDNALEIVQEVMQPAIRFHRDECIDLPPCMYETREAPLTKEQQAAYKDMLVKLHAEIDSGQVTAVNEAVKAQKLLQICTGVVYSGGEHLLLDATPRMDVVLEVIEQSASKVIVFVPFVGVIAPLCEYLESHGYSTAAIYGEVSKHERDVIFSAFQKAKDPKVLVAQPAAMSHGLTLTAASTIVWFAPLASNDIFEQANARITRPGQKHSQLIVMLEGTPIERRYYQRLKDKQNVQGILLDLIKADRVSA